jgi:hypothetical protein
MQMLFRSWLVVLLVCASKQSLAASDPGRYFMVVFGYQAPGNRPSTTHTFASFVRTDASAQPVVTNVHTISWLPADLSFTIWSGREPGVNLSYQESLNLAAQSGYQTQMWGPFEINADLYERSVQQYWRLESAEQTGAILYKSTDGGSRDSVWAGEQGGAINCIHAVTDIVGYAETGSLRGYAASAYAVQLLSPWVVSPSVQSWLLPQLGL